MDRARPDDGGLRYAKAHLWAEVARTAVAWIGRTVVAGLLVWPVLELVRHANTIELNAQVSVTVDATGFLGTIGGVILGAFGVGAWARHRSAKVERRRTMELANEKNELEKMLDPKRTSSGIMPDGSTNPVDE